MRSHSSLEHLPKAFGRIALLALLGALSSCSSEVNAASIRRPATGVTEVAPAADGTAAATNSAAEASAPADFGNAAAGTAAPAPMVELNPGGNDCAPGHYLGQLDGEYFTQAWGNGTVAVPFATGEISGQPGMEFWLERTERECTEAKFCAGFEIKGGKLRGWALPNADATMDTTMGGVGARFEMELAGELDCRTGEFRGQLLNACYDVFGTLYRMEGTVGARYDTASDAFIMGDWEPTEMPLPNALVPPDAKIGGTGAWNAMLNDDGSSPITEGDGLCDKASGFDTSL
ncbi:MAG: hypothetical protein OEZ06_27530 [Myxococcales bacterium]|nr:hypothetical protein [Myxococcales bacterium]